MFKLTNLRNLPKSVAERTFLVVEGGGGGVVKWGFNKNFILIQYDMFLRRIE